MFERYSPRSLIFQTPSAVEEFRLWLLWSCFASFSIGFSSMDKPAMAESTLVKGTDMMDVDRTESMLEMMDERWEKRSYSRDESGDGRREEGKRGR
jgi:hypothetical protein